MGNITLHRQLANQSVNRALRTVSALVLHRLPICLRLLFILLFSLATTALADKPNVVIILADDLGYGDVSCYGGSIRTSAIDAMAQRGMRFTHAYAPAATCTPSRYSLLTGEYAWRQHAKKTSILDGDAPLAIDVGRTTIASLLKGAGYATGIVGKWHVGLGDGKTRLDFNGSIKPGPIEVGFDYSYIIPATVDRVPTVWVKNHHVDNLDLNDPISVSYQTNLSGEESGWDRKDLLRSRCGQTALWKYSKRHQPYWISEGWQTPHVSSMKNFQ